MKLQTNCAWRQMNLLRCARHAGGLHHRKKQFKLVDVHWHSWGTRTPGKPGVLRIPKNRPDYTPCTSSDVKCARSRDRGLQGCLLQRGCSAIRKRSRGYLAE